MSSDLFVSSAGAVARLRELDVLANNLANADTTGFKADRVLFRTALEAALVDPQAEPTAGASGVAYVVAEGSAPDWSNGAISATGGPLDVAIQGPGFFEIETEAGPRYTRAGSFAVDADGRLVTREGVRIAAAGGSLRVGSTPAHLSAAGELVDASGRVLGRLKLVEFERPERLVKAGANTYAADAEAGPAEIDDPTLVEASLERSNVSTVGEMARLIIVQRAFEAAMESLETQDRATQQILQEVRG